METLNNPASRLLKIVKSGKSKKDFNVQASENWSIILAVPNSDKSLLLRRIGYVMALPNEIKKNIEQLDNLNSDLHLRWLPKVENAFSTLNFQIPWKQFITQFDETVLYGLEICADILSRRLPEQTVDEDQLSKLLNEVNELLSSFGEVELEEEIRNFILENLINIKNALEEYSCRGIKPLMNQFHSAIGQVAINKDLYPKSQKNSFGKKFWKVMSGLAILITITTDGPKLGNNVIAFLSNTQNETVIEKNIDDNSHQEEMEIKSIDV